MIKIEDYKLQMYVDNELEPSEIKEIQEFLNTNSEAESPTKILTTLNTSGCSSNI